MIRLKMKNNKIHELKQIDSIFPKHQLDDLIIDKLKEIRQLQNNIKLDNLEYTTKREKVIASIILIIYCFEGVDRREICQ